MPEIQFREALRQAMVEEMERDENVFLMGEEVGEYNGAYKVSEGMLARFGPRRVIDTPISEAGFCGLGVGAAMCGLRPIVEFMSWSFSLGRHRPAREQRRQRPLHVAAGSSRCRSSSAAATASPTSLGQRTAIAMERCTAAMPGLVVVAPSTPYDAKGLLKTAIRCDDPVIFLESEMMLNDRGEVPAEEYTLPIGVADIKQAGQDVTIISLVEDA